MILRRTRALIRASHPGPTVVVTLVMTALAITVGHGSGAFWVAVAIGAGQLSVGWSNDYIDSGRDFTAGRTDKPIASGEVSAAAVGIAATIAVPTTLIASLANGWQAMLIHTRVGPS